MVALPVAVGVAALALGLRRQARIARQRRQAVDVPPRIRPAAAARLRQMDQRAKIARPTIEQVRAVLCELERQAARMAEHVAPPQLVGLVTGGDEVEAVFAAPTPVPPAAPARTLAPNRWAIDSKAITEPTFDAPALALVPLGVAGGRLVWADMVGIGPRLRLMGEGAKDLAATWAAAISSGVGAHCVRVAVLDEVIPPYPDLLEPANECQAQAARSQQARYGRVHGCEALVSRQAQGSATTPWWAAARPTKVFVCVKAPDDLASGEVAVIVGGEPIEGELVIDTSAPSVDIEAFGLGTLSLVLPEAGDVEALNQELDRLSGPGEPLATLTRPPAALHQSPNVEAVDPELSFSGDASAGSGPGIDADEGINVDGGIDEHPQAASTTLLGHLEVVPVVRLLGPVEGLRPPLSKTEYQVAVLLALARRELPRFGWSEVFHLGEDPARKVIGRIKEKLGHSVLVNRTEKSSYGTTNYDHWVGRSDLDCFDDLIEAGDYVGAFSLIRGPVCCDETWLEDEMEMGLLESTNARIIDTAYRAAAILGPADRQRLRLFVRLGFPLNDTLLELLTPREEPEANLHDDFDAGWEQGDDAVEYRNQSLQDQGRDGD
ncbi:MAG: hypothetical protein ACRET5_05755 [Steroidobacteraceae bacterium]